MDWFKGKFEPETLDSPIKHGAFGLKFSFQSIDGMHIQVTVRHHKYSRKPPLRSGSTTTSGSACSGWYVPGKIGWFAMVGGFMFAIVIHTYIHT